MPIGPKRMPFWDHLAELRWRLAIIAGALFVGSLVVYFVGYKEFYDWVMGPVLPLIKERGGEIVLLGPWSPFGFRFKVALYATIVLTSPIIAWQVLAFFLPALKPKERRWFVPTFVAAVVLFLAGAAFCRYVILSPGFGWILNQSLSLGIRTNADAGLYFSGIALLLVGFGLAFEVPVVVFYLMVFNIVPYKTMRASWRIVYVALMVVASIATPDWNPLTMGGLWIALVALYEGSMLLGRIVLRKRIASQRLAEAEA